jgi:hypothetical protein
LVSFNIHLLKRATLVINAQFGCNFEVAEKSLDLLPIVRLEDANNDVDAIF